MNDKIIGSPKWLDMSIAPRDGTIIILLVDFAENSTDDDSRAITIGCNNFDNSENDQWLFAGWNWNYDVFDEGTGKPIGWWPLITPEIPR